MSYRFEITGRDGAKVTGIRQGKDRWLVTARYGTATKVMRYNNLQMIALLNGLGKDATYISMVLEGKTKDTL